MRRHTPPKSPVTDILPRARRPFGSAWPMTPSPSSWWRTIPPTLDPPPRRSRRSRPNIVVVHVPALAPALERLQHARFDAVLLDLGLPDSEGLSTLVAVAQAVPALPIVVLTGRSDEELSRAALRQGAQDYVIKGETDPDQLARALRYAIDRKRAIASVERRLRLLNDASALLEAGNYDTMLDRVARLIVSSFAELCVMLQLNPGGAVEQVHLAHARPEQEGQLQSLGDAFRDLTAPVLPEYLTAILQGRSVIVDADHEPISRVLQTDRAVEAYRRLDVRSVMLVPIAAGAAPCGVMILGSSRSAPPFDATDLATAEDLARRAALAIENGRLVREARELFDADLTGNFVAAVDGTLTDCNPAFARMLGYESGREAVQGGALAIFGGDVSWRGFRRRRGPRSPGAAARDGAARSGRRRGPRARERDRPLQRARSAGHHPRPAIRPHRAQAARGAAQSVAEDGGGRPSGGWHRARLQQSA